MKSLLKIINEKAKKTNKTMEDFSKKSNQFILNTFKSLSSKLRSSKQNKHVINRTIKHTPLSENKKVTKYSFGTLFEYENGIKIFYKPIKGNLTTIKHFYLGGPRDQKFAGLAHLTEHSLFLSKKFDSIPDVECNGFTGPFFTAFQFNIEHNDVKSELNNDEILAFENNLIDKILQMNKLFFEEVERDKIDNEITENIFENEKKVIDIEFFFRYDTSSPKDIWEYSQDNLEFNLDDKTRCGNFETLKNATFEDIAEYKKTHYTLENYYFFIQSNLDFEILEQPLLDTLDKQVKSNTNGFKYYSFENLVNKMDSSKYFIANENNGNNAIQSLFSFSLRNKNNDTLAQDLSLICLMQDLIANNYAQERNELRVSRGLIYSNYPTTIEINDAQLSLATTQKFIKENLKKFLITKANLINNAINVNFDIEKYFKIKEEINSGNFLVTEIGNEMNQSKYAFLTSQKITNEIIQEGQEYLNLLFLDETKTDIEKFENVKSLLKETEKRMNINILLAGDNIELKELPSIEYLKAIISGENPSKENYPINMAEDINSLSHIEYMKKTISTALIKVEEKEQ